MAECRYCHDRGVFPVGDRLTACPHCHGSRAVREVEVDVPGCMFAAAMILTVLLTIWALSAIAGTL